MHVFGIGHPIRLYIRSDNIFCFELRAGELKLRIPFYRSRIELETDTSDIGKESNYFVYSLGEGVNEMPEMRKRPINRYLP